MATLGYVHEFCILSHNLIVEIRLHETKNEEIVPGTRVIHAV